MYYQDKGRGPVLLLLHAFPFDGRIWAHPLARLSGNYRVIAPDFPGFGRSPAPEKPYSFAELAPAMLNELKARGVSRAVVAGNSMGGYLALAMFSRAPDFFAGFGFINSRAGPESEEGRQRRAALVARAQSEGLGFELDGASPVARQMIADATVAGYVAAQHAISTRADSTKLLQKIAVPASVIWGLDDTLVPRSEGEAVSAALPNAVFEGIEGAGHVPIFEQPEKVTGALARLAARCSGQQAT